MENAQQAFRHQHKRNTTSTTHNYVHFVRARPFYIGEKLILPLAIAKPFLKRYFATFNGDTFWKAHAPLHATLLRSACDPTCVPCKPYLASTNGKTRSSLVLPVPTVKHAPYKLVVPTAISPVKEAKSNQVVFANSFSGTNHVSLQAVYRQHEWRYTLKKGTPSRNCFETDPNGKLVCKTNPLGSICLHIELSMVTSTCFGPLNNILMLP